MQYSDLLRHSVLGKRSSAHVDRYRVPANTGIQLSSELYVPERFERELGTFLVNFSGRAIGASANAPQILALVGSPGSGKSKMAEEILRRFGIPHSVLSAGALGGMYEGDSTTAITDAYIGLGERPDVLPVGCILVDDMDLSAARSTDEQSGTVNGPLLNGKLMNLADKPDQISKSFIGEDGTPGSTTLNVKPSAIILTANDPTQLYQPLLRHGRARIFHWEPTIDELTMMVSSVLPGLRRTEARKLIERFENKAMSFFAEIPKFLANGSITNEIGKSFDPNIFASRAVIGRFAREADRARSNCTLKAAIDAGETISASEIGLANHIPNPTNGGV